LRLVLGVASMGLDRLTSTSAIDGDRAVGGGGGAVSGYRSLSAESSAYTRNPLLPVESRANWHVWCCIQRPAAVMDAILRPAHNGRVELTLLAGEDCRLGKIRRDAGRRSMTELISHPLSWAALWFAVIFALFALAIVVVRRFRGDAADDQPSANELLAKFRDLHARGGLSDDEYRTIKTKLATQLEAELNSSDEKS
jgi:hypothetical protein